MSKKVIAAVAAAIVLSAGVANAADSNAGMEKCTPTGKLVVKEHKADGVGDNTVGGQNHKGDTKSWIFVPKGMCAKVQDAGKTGDTKGLPQDIQDKLEMMAAPAAGASAPATTAPATTAPAANAGGATTGGSAAH